MGSITNDSSLVLIKGGGQQASLEDIQGPLGLFGEQRVSSGYQVLELKSTYGLSSLRDLQTTNGSATITNADGEYTLATGTTSGSNALLESAERGRYIPGVEAEGGAGIRIDHTFTSDQFAEWGYFDTENGLGFGADSDGIYVFILRGGNKTKTYQDSWNGDTLDGSGDAKNPSSITLSLARGNIFHVNFTWYGYGVIEWRVLLPDSNNVQRPRIVHREVPSNQTTLADPNLPIAANVDNGSTTTDISLFVAGRQFTVFTQYEPNRRVNGDYRLELGGVGTTFLPLVSFRRKSGDDKFRGVSIKIDGTDIVTDTALVWEFRLDADLTGADWGTPTDVSAAETACETDVSATAMSGGEFLDGGLVTASGPGSNVAGGANIQSRLDIPDVKSVTMGVRTTSGTDATVSGLFRWREEW